MSQNQSHFSPMSIIWVLLWATSFSISMSIVKLLDQDISAVMIVFIRLSFGLVFFTPFILKAGLRNMKTQKFPLHLLRIIFMCSAMVCTYHAYSHLPLAFATSIGFTGPMITTLLAILILRDKVSWLHWLLIILGYAGVLVLVRPDAVELDPAVLVALMANFFASCAIITVKKLHKTESSMQIMFYTNVFGLLLVGLAASFMWKTPSQQDMVFLAMLGITGTFSQFCYIQALKKGKPSLIAPFEYSRLVFAIPIGVMFFAEIPTLWTILGSFVIIISNYSLTYLEAQRQKVKTLPAP